MSLYDFKAELGAQLRSRYPRCTSALIVGSYAFQRPFVDDIDVAAFDESLPPDGEAVGRMEIAGWSIDVALRNPAWMDPGRAERENVLFLLREMRKVVAGIQLFDDTGLLARTVPWWRDLDIPLRLIAPFHDRARRIDLRAQRGEARRLSLYYGIENMVIGWLHAEMRFRFSKPKWLLWDLAQLGSAPFEALLRALSAELCEGADIRELIAQHSAILPADGPGGPEHEIAFCRKMLKDAVYMVDRGESPAAVWPLRMCSFHLALWTAGKMKLPYSDVRSIGPLLSALDSADPTKRAVLSAALLVDRPVPGEFIDLFEAARDDFGRFLERKGAAISSG